MPHLGGFTASAAAAFRTGLGELRQHLRIDRWMIPILLVATVMLAPLVPRSTESALKLAAFINDEPALTMNLHAMTLTPIGDPYNLDGEKPRRKHVPGPEWSGIGYAGFNYYGGFYLGTGFLAYMPLKLLGAPIFPTAPVILRIISFLAALGSLLLIYNFGRKHVGVAAGAAAALLLLSDNNFLYYASIIHPDMLQVFVGLAALVLACLHVRDRTISTLIAVGIAMGVSQSTKAGAFWFIPTACLAVWWGLPETATGWRRKTHDYIKHMFLLGMVAITAWIVTTPYIIFGDYIRMMSSTWTVVTTAHFGVGKLTDWLVAFHEQFGWPLTIMLTGGTLWVSAKAFMGKLSRPVALALVLAVSQMAWFSMTNKVWVILGYCMLAYGLMAVFAVILFQDALGALRRTSPALVVAALGLMAIPAMLAVSERVVIRTNYILQEHLRDNNTVIQLNDWAIRNNVPASSKIIWDDIAYVDPSRFPNARMLGGLMTWAGFRQREPDYMILSSSIYESPWYKKLINEQNLVRSDPYSYNVRLYQDFLGSKTGGRPVVPWIEHVHSIDPTPTLPFGRLAWMNSIRDGVPFFGPLTIAEVQKIYVQLVRTQTLIHNITGQQKDLFGTSMKVFRVRPAKDACPRETSLASGGSAPGYIPAYAFDGVAGTAWVSKDFGKPVIGTSITKDFGCETLVGGENITIGWINEPQIPLGFRIEASQNGLDWTVLGDFRKSEGPAFVAGKRIDYKLSQPMRARHWRLTVTDISDANHMALADIILAE